jgi:hypothetical protein
MQTAYLEAVGRLLDFFTQAFAASNSAKRQSYLEEGNETTLRKCTAWAATDYGFAFPL